MQESGNFKILGVDEIKINVLAWLINFKINIS